jgi:hypothetical protein
MSIPLSEEQQKVLELYRDGRNIFLTGPGGSGKSGGSGGSGETLIFKFEGRWPHACLLGASTSTVQRSLLTTCPT